MSTASSTCSSSSSSSDMPSSLKHYLKVYSTFLGLVAALAALAWLVMVLYCLSRTDPASADLLMERYLDISFGLLALTSSLALVYGAYVESKTWITAWTLGSSTVLVGYWTFFFYRKYGVASPESLERTQAWLLGLTAAYVVGIVPMLKYYRLLESANGLLKPCKRAPRRQRGACGGGVRGGVFGQKLQLLQLQRIRRKTKEGFNISVPIEEDLYNPV